MISISHKIELMPNNKQKIYFRKAFGCARLAYNWGLAEWQRRYKAGEKCSVYELKKAFNAIKRQEYPFVLEVTKFATAEPFRNLEKALKRFFEDLKKGSVSYPQFKTKKDNQGSFYIGGERVVLANTNRNSKTFKNLPRNPNGKRQYIKIPNLGWVKMTERVRFDGKINNVVISQRGSKFFASFSMMITEVEYRRTHPSIQGKKYGVVGIDLGIKQALTTSDGIAIENPKFIQKSKKKVTRLSRQLGKRVHARTKQERLQGVKKSNNYKKLSKKLSNAHRKVADTRRNFIQKTTTILVATHDCICMETLNTKGMMRNHRLAQSVSDVSFFEFKRQIEYKAAMNGVQTVFADKFYPSSKTCSVCGSIKKDLKLSERIYRCPECEAVIDRDYNAALNLRQLAAKETVGRDYPEFTPVDLAALLSRFKRNRIATSKVETGIQPKL